MSSTQHLYGTRGKRDWNYADLDGKSPSPEKNSDPEDSGEEGRNSAQTNKRHCPSPGPTTTPRQSSISSDLFTPWASQTSAVGSTTSSNGRSAIGKSWIWAYLTITEEGTYYSKRKGKRIPERIYKCNICSWTTKDSLTYGSTTNLIKHVKSKHSVLAPGEEPAPPDPRITMDGFLQPTTPFQSLSSASVTKQIELSMLKWVIATSQPFTALSNEAFINMFKSIPKVIPPKMERRSVKNKLFIQLREAKAKLKDVLSSTCASISLSLDCWTSQNGLSILAVIGHWITPQFAYQVRLLLHREVSGIHSGENLAAMIYDMLVEFNLCGKLLTITADNASNNKSMVEELARLLQGHFNSPGQLDQDEQSPIKFEGSDSFVSCAAHVINLVASDILLALKTGDTSGAKEACDQLYRRRAIQNDLSPIQRLRILAIWIHRSPQRRRSWGITCKSVNISTKYIPTDVKTRWNSTYYMLRAGVDAKLAVDRFIRMEEDLTDLKLSAQDWLLLTNIMELLSKFESWTRTFSEMDPNITLVTGLYYEMDDFFDDAEDSKGYMSSDMPESLKKAVHQGSKKYKKYYDHMDKVDTYYIAMLLDPRLKAQLLLQELGDKEAAQAIVTTMKTRLHSLYPEGEITTTAEPALEQRSHGNSLQQRIFDRLHGRVQQHSSDIDRYFAEPVVESRDGPEWLFAWWKANAATFPRMAAAAKDWLAVPASEVGVERLFSAGRDLLGLRRQRMNGATMEMLAMLKDSLRAEEGVGLGKDIEEEQEERADAHQEFLEV